ncbi:hypothetical protein AVEN_178735-1, partial [Araneus ventricosus]
YFSVSVHRNFAQWLELRLTRSYPCPASWCTRVCKSHDCSRKLGSESLLPITGQGPISPEGGTSRHRDGGNSTPQYYYAHQGSENPLAWWVSSSSRLLICELALSPGGICLDLK